MTVSTFQAAKYGPLHYNYEAAKVVIGPIICEPPPLDQRPRFSIEHRLNALEGSKEEEIKCPRVYVVENSPYPDHGTFASGIYEISKEKVSCFQIICLQVKL